MDHDVKTHPPDGAGIRCLAPAKVNLFLIVKSRRADGYHEIFSLMQPVSLYDELTVRVNPGSGITVSSDAPGLPVGTDNIAGQAAALFLERAGSAGGNSVTIDITKNIPVGAGLGGGSSDAAAVLSCLNTAFGAPFDEPALLEMAARLGSDVPFFILGGPALARGRGEVLERFKLPQYHYVLINPGFHVSTASVYGNLDLTKRPENNTLSVSEDSFADPEKLKTQLVNDLEPVTAKIHPEVGELKRILCENGAIAALMSGSGPTVFGVFPDGEQARTAFHRIKEDLGSPYRIFLAHGLG